MSQNKELPGTYINFVSSAHADATLGERGTVALLIPLQWNVGNLVRVTREDLAERSKALFGVAMNAAELLPLREALCEAQEALVYVPGYVYAASCSIARARFGGYYGNKIQIKVTNNPGWDPINDIIDVETYYDGVLVDRQIGVGGLNGKTLENNDFVIFNSNAYGTSEGTYQLEGGVEVPVTAADYQKGLDALERENFQTLVCDTEDEELRALFVNYTKRMRDECGVKFQCVLYNCAADYEGIVNVGGNKKLVGWVAGAIAGCRINENLTFKEYTGELTISTQYTQSELAAMVDAGIFAFHNVCGVPRVLSDCSSKVSDRLLSSNQTVRLLDQIANDIGVLFRDKYLGKIQNNASGRMSFWNDVVRFHKELEALGAIEEFAASDITVEAGVDKSAIVVTDRITPVNGMTKLYMTVTVV